MAFKIDHDASLIRIDFSGQLTMEDLRSIGEAADQLERLYAVTPPRLSDLTQVIGATIGFAEMETLATRRRAAKLNNPVRSAIVAPTPLQYGMARMFQTLNTNPQITIQLFHDRPVAEAWVLAKP